MNLGNYIFLNMFKKNFGNLLNLIVINLNDLLYINIVRFRYFRKRLDCLKIIRY